MCKEDYEKGVWRHFYVFDLNKEELEGVVMDSLDWMRHINLTSLCKEWKSISHIDTGKKEDHKKHHNSKYNYRYECTRGPVMKLTI